METVILNSAIEKNENVKIYDRVLSEENLQFIFAYSMEQILYKIIDFNLGLKLESSLSIKFPYFNFFYDKTLNTCSVAERNSLIIKVSDVTKSYIYDFGRSNITRVYY